MSDDPTTPDGTPDPWARPDGDDDGIRSHGDGIGPHEGGIGPDVLDRLVVDAAVPVAEVRRGGVGARVVAAVAGVALLVGGVAFAATQAGGDGAGSPEEAVQDLFDAVAAEDLLGVLASLDAGERDAMVEPVTAWFDELQRLEVLDGSFDPSAVAGLDIEIEGLELDVQPVRDDLARVHLRGGTARISTDGEALPLGAFVTDTLERFGVDRATLTSSDSGPVDEGDDTFLVAHDGPDGWRVSIGYTAVESARLDLGAPVPAGGLAPIGADDPAAAVEDLLRAGFALDLDGVIARLSPAELGAVQDYWPVLGPGPGEAPELPEGVEVRLVSLDTEVEADGDRARVRLRGVDVEVDTPDGDLGILVGDGCLALRGSLAEEIYAEAASVGGIDLPDPICIDDLPALVEEQLGLLGSGDPAADLLGGPFAQLELPDAGGLALPAPVVAAQRVDGAWYVALVRTGAESSVQGLRALERSDLDAVVDVVEQLVTGFQDAFAFPVGGALDGSSDDLFADDLFGDVDLGGGFPGIDDDDPDPFGYASLPRPGASDDVFAAEAWEVLRRAASVATPDPTAAACVLDVLQATASTSELYELADRTLYDLPARTPVARRWDEALAACGAG